MRLGDRGGNAAAVRRGKTGIAAVLAGLRGQALALIRGKGYKNGSKNKNTPQTFSPDCP